MGYFSKNLRNAFDSDKELSSFRTALDLGIDPAVMSKVLHGKRKPPKGFIDLLATIPELKLSVDEMMGWKILDEYSPLQVISAIQTLVSSIKTEKTLLRLLESFKEKY